MVFIISGRGLPTTTVSIPAYFYYYYFFLPYLSVSSRRILAALAKLRDYSTGIRVDIYTSYLSTSFFLPFLPDVAAFTYAYMPYPLLAWCKLIICLNASLTVGFSVVRIDCTNRDLSIWYIHIRHVYIASIPVRTVTVYTGNTPRKISLTPFPIVQAGLFIAYGITSFLCITRLSKAQAMDKTIIAWSNMTITCSRVLT